jgi:hypothetical protein
MPVNDRFWQIVLKNSPTSSSGPFLRNNDSMMAGKLNHPCARELWRDRVLRAKAARGVFQQDRHVAEARAGSV